MGDNSNFGSQVIACHGRRPEEIDKALDGIREIRQGRGRIDIDELLSGREEGRKY